MTKPNIICVDDQREVLSSLVKDLQPFSKHFEITDCESGEEALDLINELDASGAEIALIISDQVMPEMCGVDFLESIQKDPRFSKTRKLLLTGQASHEDTIRAINIAKVDNYIAKPWKPDSLLASVKKLLSQFVFDAELDYRDYEGSLDSQIIFERLS